MEFVKNTQIIITLTIKEVKRIYHNHKDNKKDIPKY